MHRFYWLDHGRLAGCSRPGARPGRRDPDPSDLAADLAALAAEGIGALLTLTETALPSGDLERAGLHVRHLPVIDFAAPDPDQFVAALQFIDEQQAAGRAVAVHCLAGQGRTGSILAAARIRAGATAAEAIAAVRAVCPGAVESEAQAVALEAFAFERPWIT
ncbi:MAG: fused DSP-PTPase phosphatase/NAD kinase-like protein [Chloroflexota bacterium]